MLTIGDFSKLGRAVARAPRHDGDAGLLVSMRAALLLICLAFALVVPRRTAAARAAALAPPSSSCPLTSPGAAPVHS